MLLSGDTSRTCRSDGKAIVLSLGEPVEFKVLPLDD